jgi:hypothetical protein
LQDRLLASHQKNLEAIGTFNSLPWAAKGELSNCGGSCNFRRRFEAVIASESGYNKYLVGWSPKQKPTNLFSASTNIFS